VKPAEVRSVTFPAAVVERLDPARSAVIGEQVMPPEKAREATDYLIQ